jgi:shikimate kinase
LSGRAQAVAHGAATIVNAIALGKGAAFGVDLWTKAEVQLTDDPGIVRGEIATDLSESTVLIEKAVGRVFRHFGVEKSSGAKVKTTSNIPIARGLKSSSAAANAVVLATTAALGKNLDDLTLVNLGVDAAFDAKVTVTGAFDDACASFFGDVIVTNNATRDIVQRFTISEDVIVLFHVPPLKSYTADSNVRRIKTVEPLVKIAYEEAIKGNYWASLTLNGLIYSSILGFNSAIAIDALNAGALAAGLCGKGPSVTAVVSKDNVDSVKAALQSYPGEILQAHLNHEKAKVS